MSKEESIRSVICGNLNRLLHQRKMTQKELSEYMSVSASTVNDWVRGKKIPRMDKVDKLCSIFGVSREEILYDHSSRTNPAATPAPPAPQKSSRLPELNARDERNRTTNGGPAHASAREMHQLEKILAEPNLTYNGVALGAEDIEKINRALELAFWDAKEKNKRKR